MVGVILLLMPRRLTRFGAICARDETVSLPILMGPKSPEDSDGDGVIDRMVFVSVHR